MALIFRAFREDRPSERLAGLFRDFWPAYHRWWASEGYVARPTYSECRRAIATHMPEMLTL